MKTIFLILCLTLLSVSLFAQEEVKIKDGRTIIINNNGTWKFKKNTSKNTQDNKKSDGTQNNSTSTNSCDKYIGKWETKSGARFLGILTISQEGDNYIITTGNGLTKIAKCNEGMLQYSSPDPHHEVSYSKERDHLFFFNSEWQRVN